MDGRGLTLSEAEAFPVREGSFSEPLAQSSEGPIAG
jgi:hypothetical protein